jgi:hypothetical protein
MIHTAPDGRYRITLSREKERSLYQTSGLLDKSKPLVYKKIDSRKAA